MISLRLLILSVTLIPSLWAEQSAASSVSLDKRFSINMMDPFTRRSALDKNFVRFGRSGGGINVNRESRGRSDSFVRFGRGNDEEEDVDEITPRDARGRTDFIRFGRGGSNSGFIRFGRGRNDNFVRFGRARQDNFIRFGKSDHSYPDLMKDDDTLQRFARSGNGPRGQNTNFVRFGKRDPEHNEEIVNAYKNGLNFDLDEFRKENLARIARLSNRNKGDSFIRFGRMPSFDEELSRQFGTTLKDKYYPNSQQPNPEYNIDSQTTDSELEPSKSTTINSDTSSDLFSSYDQPGNELSRQKRSPSNDLPPSTDSPDVSPFYNYPSPLAAGLPNFIIGPELSVLPPHSKTNNRGIKIDDKNFIRLG